MRCGNHSRRGFLNYNRPRCRQTFEHLDTVSLSDKQKNKFLSKEGAMKRIIMLAMVLVMMLVSIGGCWVGWDRDGRGEGQDRDGGHDRGGEHDRDGGHDRH